MNEIIVDTTQARNLEQLNEEEKRIVDDKLSTLDYMNPSSIIQFGSESSKEVTAISTQMISKFKVKDFEDAQFLISNLIGDLKTVDADTLLETKQKGFLSKLPFISQKAQSRITNLLTQQMTIEKAIDEVEDKLVASKVTLMGDMEFCSQMIKKTYEYAKNLEIDYITIQEATKQAQEEKEQLEQLFMQNSNNMEYSAKIADLNRAIRRLELKAYNLLVFRTSTLQSVTQIGLVQGGDELMVSKIDDTIINVIPAWKRNFAIALATYRLNNAVSIEKMVNDATNKLLVKNSEMLKETMLQTAVEMERPSIDPETLQAVNTNLQETFDGLSKVTMEAKKVRQDAIKTVQSIQTLALELNSGSNIEQLSQKGNDYVKDISQTNN